MQEKLHEAVKAKLTEQRRFVLWWDAQDLNALGNTTLADRQQYPDNSTIHRWRRRLKSPDKFAEALEAAHERTVAKALGVDESTVRADLGKRAAGNPAAPPTEAAENNGADTADAANPAPAWFQDDADPSKLAKSRERIQKARTNKILVITMPLVFCRELDLHDGSTYDIDARP